MPVTRVGALSLQKKASFRNHPVIFNTLVQYIQDLNTSAILQENIGLSAEQLIFLKRPIADLCESENAVAKQARLLQIWVGGRTDLFWTDGSGNPKLLDTVVSEISSEGEALEQLSSYLDNNIQTAITGLLQAEADLTPPAA